MLRFELCLLTRGSKAVQQVLLRATSPTSALPLTARRVYSYWRGEALPKQSGAICSKFKAKCCKLFKVQSEMSHIDKN